MRNIRALPALAGVILLIVAAILALGSVGIVVDPVTGQTACGWNRNDDIGATPEQVAECARLDDARWVAAAVMATGAVACFIKAVRGPRPLRQRE